jgi:Na+/H+ antiporter NhaC
VRTRSLRLAALLPLSLCLAVGAPSAAAPVEIFPPVVAVEDVTTTLGVEGGTALPASRLRVEIWEAGEAGTLVGAGFVAAGERTTIELTVRATGLREYLLLLPDGGYEPVSFSLRAIPGWLTLLPPLIAILLALIFRQVIPALAAGIWVGAWICHDGPFKGALRAIDNYVIQALADTDHVSIIVFSLLLGGMVGVVSRSGGMIGLVEVLTPRATNSRRGQLVTWLLGILVFFDDYANTLLVGNTMRPVTDRLKISREKLAYIVDSTAAPISSIALVSTWIGYEVSLIGDSLKAIGSDPSKAYGIFIQSLPYRFYPILALVFGLMIAGSLRDFGPMLKAERRARKGKTFADAALPLSDFDGSALQPPEGKPKRWLNALAPVLVVLIATFAGLWFTGRAGLAESSGLPAGLQGIGAIFGAGDSFRALLWGSLAGCLTALLLSRVQGILTLGEGIAAWLNGIKSMTAAVVILILAWAIAAICVDLNTSGYMVASLSDHLVPGILPAIVFILAALTSFATGTSWGTMGILIPLTVPTAFGVAQASGLDPTSAHGILLGAVSSVLAGAIFGDHCSPISDTTILSSMSSGCDHIDHVRTQLPYAVVVGLVGVLLCDIPSGFGISPWICLLVGGAVLAGILRWLGRRSSG